MASSGFTFQDYLLAIRDFSHHKHWESVPSQSAFEVFPPWKSVCYGIHRLRMQTSDRVFSFIGMEPLREKEEHT